MLKKYGTLFLFLCLFVFTSALVAEGIYSRHQFKQRVLTDQDVERIHGVIKRAKKHYAGRSWDNLNLWVKGESDWIQVHKVSDLEISQLKEGAQVALEVYQPPRLWMVDDFSLSRRFVLGVEADGQILRNSQHEKNSRLRSLNIMVGSTLLGLLLVSVGICVAFKLMQAPSRP